MIDCSVTTLQKKSASRLIWKFYIIEAQSDPTSIEVALVQTYENFRASSSCGNPTMPFLLSCVNNAKEHHVYTNVAFTKQTKARELSCQSV